jgi:hypothetical protein
VTRAMIVKATTDDRRLGVPAGFRLGTDVEVDLDSTHVMVLISTSQPDPRVRGQARIQSWIARELIEVAES